jgi:hypothetical protein
VATPLIHRSSRRLQRARLIAIQQPFFIFGPGLHPSGLTWENRKAETIVNGEAGSLKQ